MWMWILFIDVTIIVLQDNVRGYINSYQIVNQY
jgi:hypothetical protein